MKITLDDVKRQNGESIESAPQLEPDQVKDEKITFQGEMAKLKEMTLREKIAYLWEYYHTHAIIAVVILILVIGIPYSILHQKEYCFSGTMLNISTTDLSEDMSYLDSYLEYANIDPDEYEFSMRSSMYLSGSEADDYNTTMLLTTLVAASELDFILCDEAQVEYLAHCGYTADLETVLPTETYEKYKDRMVFATIDSDEDARENRPAAIEVTDSHITQGLSIITEKYYIIFVTNAKHADQFATFLDYLFEYQPNASAESKAFENNL